MADSISGRLCTLSLRAGTKPLTLYVTTTEARMLARELRNQITFPITIEALEEVLLSDTALLFGRPLRIKDN
jgi:hypothetical protein